MTASAGPGFAAWYADLRGREPFPWMTRLAAKVADGGWPDQIALPTGAGKSEVALIWAWAREQDPRHPRRLWIASDRRVIVDQAFDGARALDIKGVLASRLRGGVALDADAVLDLERPQVISCTIDQFGSRLLFRGYGVAPRSWPIHAALAGTDSLVVLDEAHLSPNAEAIFQACRELGADLRVVSMTATPRGEGAAFTLDAQDRAHPVLGRRLAARRLVEMRAGDTLASVAQSFLRAGHRRIAMVANTVAAARTAFEETKHATGAGGEAEVHLLIGRQRPIDRDRILEELLPKLRSGAGEVERPVIVATTQAIEVGADLDFDAMVSEGCPIDALVQRLGRLDRLGHLGVSRCVLLKPEKNAPPYGEAPAKAWAWLSEQVRRHPEGGAAKVVDLGSEAWAALVPDVPEELRSPRSRPVTLLGPHLRMLTRTSPRPAVEPDVDLLLHGPDRAAGSVSVVWREAMADEDLNEPEPISDYLRALPPAALEACPVPVWELRAWLRHEPQGDTGDVEGGVVAEPAARTRRSDQENRRVLRWDGSEDGAVAVSAASIRPGDVVLLPTSAGGYDAQGWAAQSDARVTDLAEAAAERRWGGRVVQIAGRDLDETAIEAALLARGVDRARATVRSTIWGRGAVVHVRPRLDGPAADPHRKTGLAAHQVRVAEHAAKVAGVLGLDTEVLRLAGVHHDDGKADPRWQVMVHGGDLARATAGPPLAKGRLNRRAWPPLPRGWRHERESVRRLDTAGILSALRREDRDLVRWLVITHHGHARPLWPLGGEEPQDWRQPELQARLEERLGPWRLALHEAVLRLADRNVSQEEAKGRYVGADEAAVETSEV